MFANNKNIIISGSPSFNASAQNLSPDKIDEGLKILIDHAAPGALHNSGERFDPPNCHPGTRIAVIEEIKSWIDDTKSERPVMWLKGPMGGGKSSIAQALAELYNEIGRLSGSFFFARASPTRNNEKSLVATLAYQMWIKMPHTQPSISASICQNPLIFESSLKQQVEILIITPHVYTADSNMETAKQPRLIIIDGLDECINTNFQAVIVEAFVSSIGARRAKQDKLHIPLKILIVSRAEVNINAAFRNRKHSSLVRFLSLDKRWLPDQDIEKFLTDSFVEIKCSHPIGNMLPSHWPPFTDIYELVKRSSGQFIYASVVIKFLQSPQNHPIESLKVIIGLSKDSNSQPYAELDALYAHIFSKVKNLPLVLRILCLRLVPCINGKIDSSEINDILELPQGMLMVALTDLVSVLDYNPKTNGEIRFHHASMSEFLQDQDRSGEFYVNREDVCMDLAGHCIPFDKNAGHKWSIKIRGDVCMSSYEHLSAEARSSLCDALSNMDILPMLEVAQYDILTSPTKYCSWLFAEHAKNLKIDLPNSLENAVKSFAAYILQQFKAFPFSGFDRTDGIDIWIIGMFKEYYSNNEAIEEQALSILTGLHRSKSLQLQGSPSIQLCWKILDSIPLDILRNSELFGEYAITDDRCIRATLCIFKAIPKMKLSKDDPLRKFIMYDKCRIVSKLLQQMPASEKLYKTFKVAMLQCTSKNSGGDFLQELAYEYILSTFGLYVRHNYNYSKKLASILSNYMEKTRQVIPNIDFIIEQEMQTNTLKGRIHQGLKRIFRGKKS